jgi:hypothetical protein
MSPADPPRLVIELDLTAEPIGGWLTSPAAGARPFAGWLDLMAALERARAAELHANPIAQSAEPTSGTNPGDDHVQAPT